MNELNVIRVHIIPVGYEFDRIVQPAIQMRADRVWLCTHTPLEQDQAKYSFDKCKNYLLDEGVEVHHKQCNIYQFIDVIRAVREILEEEKNNLVFVNVSSGNKIMAIGGMMACMMFRDLAKEITPYYVRPEKYHFDPTKEEFMSTGIKDIFPLPSYRIERPNDELIALLEIIKVQQRPVSKTELIQELEKAGKIAKKLKAPARLGLLNRNYIQPLLIWNYIEVLKCGRESLIKITKLGEDALHAFSSKFVD